MKSTKYVLGAAVSALALTAGTTANAGSFALKERSAKAQGLSFAGVTAGSGGLQSMGFNPAAIGTVAPGAGNAEMSGGLSLIAPISDGVVSNGTTVDADTLGFVANQYVGYRLDEEFLIGLAIYTPFGLATSNKENATISNDGATSKLATIVIAPTIGYAPFPDLTLAASFNLTYVDARLTSSAFAVDGKTWDYSFSAGALWNVTPSTTVGLAYQHGYDFEIPGTFTFAGGTFGAEADARLPSTVSLGVVQELTDDFRVMGEVQWQNWSVFDKIDINVPAIGLSQQDQQNYDDAFFVAIGGEYDVLNDLTVRVGAAWDQTPTNDDILAGQINPGATNRTVRVPDEDRIWLSIGGTYEMNDHMSVDIGYSYLFALEDPVVGVRNAAPGTTVTYDGGAHIFSVGGSLKF